MNNREEGEGIISEEGGKENKGVLWRFVAVSIKQSLRAAVSATVAVPSRPNDKDLRSLSMSAFIFKVI